MVGVGVGSGMGWLWLAGNGVVGKERGDWLVKNGVCVLFFMYGFIQL